MKRKTFAHGTFLALSMLACGLLQHCKPEGGIVLPEKPGGHPSQLADKWRISEIKLSEDATALWTVAFYKFTYNEFNKAAFCSKREISGDTTGYVDWTYYYDAAQKLTGYLERDSLYRWDDVTESNHWFIYTVRGSYTYDATGRVTGYYYALDNQAPYLATPVSYEGDSVVIFNDQLSKLRYSFDTSGNVVRKMVNGPYILGPYDRSLNLRALTTVPEPKDFGNHIENDDYPLPIYSRNNVLDINWGWGANYYKYTYNADSLIVQADAYSWYSNNPPYLMGRRQFSYIKVP